MTKTSISIDTAQITDAQYDAAQDAMNAWTRKAYRGSDAEKAEHKAALDAWEAVHALPERTYDQRVARDREFLAVALRLGLL